jgi:hypothetical protein
MGYQTQFTLGGNFDLPVNGSWEAGPVRYKFRFEGRFEASCQIGPPPFSVAPNDVAVQAKADVEAQWRPSFAMQLSDSVEANVGGELSGESLRELSAAHSNPRRFGQLCLQSLNLGVKFQLPGNSYLESVSLGAALDADFCFFSASIERAARRYPLSTGQQSVEITLPASFTVYFGPSKALWLNMVGRLGPTAFRTFIRTLIPGAGAEGAAAAGFWGWLGPLAIAVPIAITIRDLSVFICRRAWETGVRRGHLNYFSVCYARTVFGLATHTPPPGGDRFRMQAVRLAEEHCNRFGRDGLMHVLERHYFHGKGLIDKQGRVDERNVQVLGDRMGADLESGAPMWIGQRY